MVTLVYSQTFTVRLLIATVMCNPYVILTSKSDFQKCSFRCFLYLEKRTSVKSFRREYKVAKGWKELACQ